MLATTFVSQLLLLAIPSVVYAQSCSTSSSRTCSTKLAAVPNWWPVYTYLRTSNLPAVTVTTTPVVTTTAVVAAAPVTATVQITMVVTSTTTATPTTDTLYLTSTVYSTTSVSTTSTTTNTITTTVLTVATDLQTAIVAAPTSFINIYNSSGDSTYAGYKRSMGRRFDSENRFSRDKRGNLAAWLTALFSARRNGGRTGNRTGLSASKKSIPLNQFSNPVAVSCVANVQKTCVKTGLATTYTVTSTAAPSTTTSTISSTITAISTVVPPAVTVTVFSATTTSLVTQLTTIVTDATNTFTATSTSTSSLTTSIYAACATGNLLGPRLQNGYAVDNTYFYDSNALVVLSTERSAYDCCVTCQTSNYCQFFQYSGASGQCHVTGQDADWCPNMQQDYNFPSYFTYTDATQVTDSVTVGNGACGTMMDLGQETGSS